MDDVRIKAPIWDGGNRQAMIPSTTLNYFFREKIADKFNFWQSTYNLIEFVQLSKDQTFRINTIQGDFPMWQKDVNCKVEPMGRQSITSRSIDQEKLRLYSEWCYKETYDTAFKGLMNWTPSGTHDLTELTVLTAPMQREYLVQATKGLLNLNILGGLFDTSDKNLIEGGATDGVLVDFAKEANAMTGLLAKIKNRSSKYAHMYQPNIFGSDKAGISVVDLFKELVDSAPSDLRDLVYEGSSTEDFGGRTVEPVMVVSSNLLKNLFSELQDAAESPFSNKDLLSAIERRTTVYNGRPVMVYHIFGVPVIPLKQFCAYNKYLASDFYFAAVTTTRNIQIGTNFGPLGSGEDGPTIGVTFQQEMSIADGKKGMVYWDAHAICGSDIANPNLFSGTWKEYPA